MTTPDIHKTARAIAGQLAASGRAADSDAVVNAMRAGFTGTEILMRLRHTLAHVDATSLPANLAQRIHELVVELNRLLD